MTASIDNAFIQFIESTCNARLSDVKLIQSLWSGYGACFRANLHYRHACTDSQSKTAPIVAKCTAPPATLNHPRGWNGKPSHDRKLASFAVENSFYQHLQPYTNAQCKVPSCIATNQTGNRTFLVMEDLRALGFTETADTLSVSQAETVLSWLGAFHAQFLGVRDTIKNKGILVWDEGSYWHLGTRKDEYDAMAEGPLKTHAHAIADTLSNASYQTLIHGDAKVANFCFTKHFDKCAAVDFQYAGFGVGVKDVAYFLGSALSTRDQHQFRSRCLDVYFDALRNAYINRCNMKSTESCLLPLSHAIDIDDVIEQWRALYCVACADFHRFLAGWSPSHWKIDDELASQTEKALHMFRTC
ncbi:ecdysteroid 22-kinase family protein [Alteromonas sp. McT4-15]|uniref:ecdysteroid 22-kinase family protein n=1 Tax=Alteromonas sp. McT4-15 TaxID=2881256 RepID=UPI001CF92B83|nr:ecdysteroid 22-kinase family protein [Alteromonas sp. McT4-15]MCB4436501.1 ecdysteroid 22-kinase family protein [Alteromonas sp. McT4-15]